MKVIGTLLLWTLSLLALLCSVGVVLFAFMLATGAQPGPNKWLSVALVACAALMGLLFAAASNPLVAKRVKAWSSGSGRLLTIGGTTAVGLASLGFGVWLTISGQEVSADPIEEAINGYVLGSIEPVAAERGLSLEGTHADWLEAIAQASDTPLDDGMCRGVIENIEELLLEKYGQSDAAPILHLRGTQSDYQVDMAALPRAQTIWSGVKVRRLLDGSDSLEEVERRVAEWNATSPIERLRADLDGPGGVQVGQQASNNFLRSEIAEVTGSVSATEEEFACLRAVGVTVTPRDQAN